MNLKPQQKLAVVAGLLAMILSFAHAGFTLFYQNGVLGWGCTGLTLLIGMTWCLVFVRWRVVWFLQALGLLSHTLLVMIVFYDRARGMQAGFHSWMMQTSPPFYHIYLMQISIYAILLAIYFIEPHFRQDFAGKCVG